MNFGRWSGNSAVPTALAAVSPLAAPVGLTAVLQVAQRRRFWVALAVGQGRTNAHIAAELFMSVATVKAHISRILTKLEVGNRTQVALLVHDAGLA